MPIQDGITGEDVRSGITQADDVMHSVRADLKGLAQDTRPQGLSGNDRAEFYKGMTQDEYDTLKDIALSMGNKGTAKLESILQEMMAVRGQD